MEQNVEVYRNSEEAYNTINLKLTLGAKVVAMAVGHDGVWIVVYGS